MSEVGTRAERCSGEKMAPLAMPNSRGDESNGKAYDEVANAASDGLKPCALLVSTPWTAAGNVLSAPLPFVFFGC